MKRFLVPSLVALIAMFALLAAPAGTRAQSSSQEIDLQVSEFTISPDSINVTQGQMLHFVVTNTGKFPHNISFKQGDQVRTVFATPIKGGQSGTADFTFPAAGNWEMFCPVGNHAAQGMTGQALVLASSTGTSAGLPATGQPTDQPWLVAGLAGMLALACGIVVRSRTQARNR